MLIRLTTPIMACSAPSCDAMAFSQPSQLASDVSVTDLASILCY
jgi:hypothetical protein